MIPVFTIHREFARLDEVNCVLICCAIKGWLTTEENVHNDTDGPDIAFLTVCTLNDFRSQIVGCAEDSMHRMVRIDTPGRCEINELDHVIIDPSEMDVLRLDVSMHNVL